MTFIPRMSQGRKLTFLGRRQLATNLFFSVAKWENVGDQLWNSGRQCKIFSCIGNQESAIPNPACLTINVHTVMCAKGDGCTNGIIMVQLHVYITIT